MKDCQVKSLGIRTEDLGGGAGSSGRSLGGSAGAWGKVERRQDGGEELDGYGRTGDSTSSRPPPRAGGEGKLREGTGSG